MATFLAVLSIMPLVLISLAPVFCWLECAKCRERREQARVDMQLMIGRAMGREKRAKAEMPPVAGLILRQAPGRMSSWWKASA